MTVNKLGDNRVLITLCRQDMNDFVLDFSTMSFRDSHFRRVLIRITQVACRKTGISTNGKSVNVEAMQLGDDCYLLITVDKQRKNRSYRLKRSGCKVCYNVGGADNLLEAVGALNRERLYCPRNSLWLHQGDYWLLFSYTLPEKARRLLGEFSKNRGGALLCASVEEYGKEVCGRNAVAQIGKWL